MAAQLLLSLACLFVSAMLGFSTSSFTLTFKYGQHGWQADCHHVPVCEDKDKANSTVEDMGRSCWMLHYTDCRPGSDYTDCQLTATAHCRNQGRQNSSNYAETVLTLNFPYDAAAMSNTPQVQTIPNGPNTFCALIWKEGPRSMQQGPELQCKKNSTYQDQEVNYNCTFGNGSVCRNDNAKDSDDIIVLASVMTTVSLLLLLVTLAMMIAMAQKKCRKYISNKSLLPVRTCVSIISCILLRSKQSKEECAERMTPAAPVDAEPSRQADTKSTCSSQYALSHLPDCTVTSQHANEYRGSATGDEWEIPWSEIDVGVELSQGSYGQVFRGKLKLTAKSPNMDAHRKLMEFEGKPCLTIAVKMARSSSSVEECKLFSDEINVMKRVSEGYSNPHVLQMIGCVIVTFPMMLLLEYLPNGSLKDYLRSSQFASAPPDARVHCKKFTSFGYQIASGMEFLTSKAVIHRDLACRNVLVGDNELLKICDFGLAKETLDYFSEMKNRLPIRWMSPETFISGHFSEKSDVWAYGVCLWEIFSIGAQPYEGTDITAIPARVLAGQRLECPEGCPEQVYSMMTDCWNGDKDSRPTFQEIKLKIDGLISDEEGDNYITPGSTMVEI